MKKRFFVCLTVLLSGYLAILPSCGGGSSGTGETSGTAVSASSIFPTDLVVTSPFASTSGTPSVSPGKAIGKATVEDFETKKEALSTIINGTAATSCTFSPTLLEAAYGSPLCFGPSITLTNHPEADNMTIDDGMGGGDLLIWNDNQDGEACAAAKINQLVSVVGGYVDTAVNIFAMMSCVMDVNGIELPAEDADAVDVTDEVNDVIESNNITGLTVTSATFAHQADDADGHDVYFFTFLGAYTDGAYTKNINLYLKHVPLDDDNTTYSGKISFAYPDASPTEAGNCEEQGVTSVTDAGSVLYNKASADSIAYRMMSAQHCGSDTDPFTDSYDIDPTNTIAADNLDGWANNFQYALFRVNPEDGTGSYAYAWTAGFGSENTRVLNAVLTTGDDGTKMGCAYAGYGPTINDGNGAGNLGSITGMICNWNYSGTATEKMQARVQRQCMTYDTADGRFESIPATPETDPDRALKISFAPVLDCSDTDGNTGFIYTSDGIMTNDNITGVDRTNNLLAYDTFGDAFTLPAEPVDVY